MGAGFAPIQNVQLADHVHNVHVERDGYLQILCWGIAFCEKRVSAARERHDAFCAQIRGPLDVTLY